jgi:WD40 repeat protein
MAGRAACAPRPVAPALLRTLSGHTDTVRALSLSKDGAVLYSGSWDGAVRAWRAADGAPLYTLPAGGGAVLALAQSASGELLFAGCEGGDVRVWRGRSTRTLRGHAGPVRALAAERGAADEPAADADPLLYSAGDDGAVRVWRCGEGACVATLRGARGPGGTAPPPLWSLALSRDGDTLYAGADDGSIAVWQTRQRAAAGAMRGHTGAVRALVLSRDDAVLYSAGEDRDIRAWTAATGQCTLQLRGHAFTVLALALSRDGAALYSGSWDHTLRVVRPFVIKLTAPASLVADTRSHAQWRTSDGECVHCVGGGSGGGGGGGGGSAAASESGRGAGAVGPSDAVWSLALSPDGAELYTASSDCTVRAWRVAASPWASCAPRCGIRGGYSILAAMLGLSPSIEAPPGPASPGAAAAAGVLARGGRTGSLF